MIDRDQIERAFHVFLDEVEDIDEREMGMIEVNEFIFAVEIAAPGRGVSMLVKCSDPRLRVQKSLLNEAVEHIQHKQFRS